MKFCLPILFVALIFFGCKKSNQSEDKPEATGKKYDVTFNLQNFAPTLTTFSASGEKQTQAVGDTLKNYADNLYYRVFNADGTLVKEINQASTSPDFGTISDQLPSGNYVVAIIASKGSLKWINPPNGFSDFSYFSPSNNTWNDTFGKKIDLTVGTTSVTQAVRLDRLVGGLEVNILDAIPANVATIEVFYSKDYPGMTVYFSAAGVSQVQGKIYTVTATDIGNKLSPFFFYTVERYTSFRVSITAYDASRKVLADKRVYVTVGRNQKAVLTGNLFAPMSAGFTATVNPNWNAPILTTF